MKITTLLPRALFLAASLFCAVRPLAADNQRPVFLLQTSLTGPYAPYGADIRDGAILAQESLGLEAGIELIFEDNRGIPADAITIFRRYPQAKIHGVFPPGAIHAVASLAEEQEVPLIAFTASPRVSAGRRFVLRHFNPLTAQSALIEGELRRRGYRTVAVVGGESAISEDMLQALQNAAEPRELNVFRTSFTEMDFKAVISKLRQLSPDVIVVALFAPQLSAFARQARAGGVKAPFFGFGQFEHTSEILAAQGALDGSQYPASVGEAAFMDSFRRRFSRDPLLGAANGYDAVLLAHRAAQSAGGITVESLVQKEIAGAFGTYSFNSATREFEVPVRMRRIEGGRILDVP